ADERTVRRAADGNGASAAATAATAAAAAPRRTAPAAGARCARTLAVLRLALADLLDGAGAARLLGFRGARLGQALVEDAARALAIEQIAASALDAGERGPALALDARDASRAAPARREARVDASAAAATAAA